MLKEIWKQMRGYELLYEISNKGRIKSIKNGNKRFLTLSNDYRVCISKDGIQKSVSVKRLVAENFIPNPDFKPTVKNINGIRGDDRVDNLEWVGKKRIYFRYSEE